MTFLAHFLTTYPSLIVNVVCERPLIKNSLHLRSSNLSHLITSENIQHRRDLCKYFKVQTQNIQSLQSHNSYLIMESASKNSINGFNKISYLPQVDFIFFWLWKVHNMIYRDVTHWSKRPLDSPWLVGKFSNHVEYTDFI